MFFLYLIIFSSNIVVIIDNIDWYVINVLFEIR